MIYPGKITFKKINEELNRISRGLIEKHNNLQNIIDRALVVEANNLRNYIITSMRNTPKAPWKYKSGKGISTIHHPSLPGNPPAIDKGELISRILYDVKDKEMRVGLVVGAKHGVYLEDPENTRPVGRRRWLKPAVDSNQKRIINNVSAELKKEFGNI
jgi:hypothetical protein